MSDFLRGHRCDERVSSRHEAGGGRDVPGKKEMTRKASSPKRFEPACSARSMPARRSSGKKREIKWNFPLVLRSAFASTPPTAHAGNFDTEARTGTFAWAMHDAQRCVDATRYPRILSTRKGRVNPGRFVALFREGCRVSIDTSELDFFHPQKKKSRTPETLKNVSIRKKKTGLALRQEKSACGFNLRYF